MRQAEEVFSLAEARHVLVNEAICGRKGWAKEGYAYSNLVVAWPEIIPVAANIKAETPTQVTMDDVLKGT